MDWNCDGWVALGVHYTINSDSAINKITRIRTFYTLVYSVCKMSNSFVFLLSAFSGSGFISGMSGGPTGSQFHGFLGENRSGATDKPFFSTNVSGIANHGTSTEIFKEGWSNFTQSRRNIGGLITWLFHQIELSDQVLLRLIAKSKSYWFLNHNDKFY